MTDLKSIGWEELDALQTLARGASLDMMRKPLKGLTDALPLGGCQFSIASPEPDGYRILAVTSGGRG